MVAEGVEDQASLDELALHGGDLAQGFHVSRPVPAPVLEHWLDTRTPMPLFRRREQRAALDV